MLQSSWDCDPLAWFQRMHCLSRGPVSSVGSLCLRSKVFHQQFPISQFTAQNHSHRNQPRDDQQYSDKVIIVSDPKKLPLPKYVHNFYLPMGAKKHSFSERRSMVKDRRLNLKTSQKVDSKISTRNLLSNESTLLLCNPLEPNQQKNVKKENPKKPNLDFVKIP